MPFDGIKQNIIEKQENNTNFKHATVEYKY